MGEIPCCIDLSDYNYNANALRSQAKLTIIGKLHASVAHVVSTKIGLTGICLRIRLLLYSIHKRCVNLSLIGVRRSHSNYFKLLITISYLRLGLKMEPLKLKLFTKPDCPLCDEAKDALKTLSASPPIQIEEIDITSNLGLFTKYKNRIPVLEMDGKRMFEHRIDVRLLKRKLMWKRFCRKFLDSV